MPFSENVRCMSTFLTIDMCLLLAFNDTCLSSLSQFLVIFQQRLILFLPSPGLTSWFIGCFFMSPERDVSDNGTIFFPGRDQYYYMRLFFCGFVITGG